MTWPNLEHKRTVGVLLVDGGSLVAVGEHRPMAVRVGDPNFHLSSGVQP